MRLTQALLLRQGTIENKDLVKVVHSTFLLSLMLFYESITHSGDASDVAIGILLSPSMTRIISPFDDFLAHSLPTIICPC